MTGTEAAEFSTDLDFYGVTVQGGRRITLEVWRESARDHDDLVAAVEWLWGQGSPRVPDGGGRTAGRRRRSGGGGRRPAPRTTAPGVEDL